MKKVNQTAYIGVVLVATQGSSVLPSWGLSKY